MYIINTFFSNFINVSMSLFKYSFISFVKTLKNIQAYGIETNNESSITLAQNAKGQIDEIISQLNKGNILIFKSPYF